MLIPNALLSFAIEKKFHVVVIGDWNLEYMEEFYKQNSIISITSIGCGEEQINDFSLFKNKKIEIDFSSINVNHTHPLDSSAPIPQRIKDVFKSSKRYLILSSLYKKEAVLSNEIIHWLDMKQHDYWFFGSIPLLNPRIAPWVEQLFSENKSNHRIRIYDINIYMNKLRHENGDMKFSDAAILFEDRLVGELNDFYKNLLV